MLSSWAGALPFLRDESACGAVDLPVLDRVNLKRDDKLSHGALKYKEAKAHIIKQIWLLSYLHELFNFINTTANLQGIAQNKSLRF